MFLETAWLKTTSARQQQRALPLRALLPNVPGVLVCPPVSCHHSGSCSHNPMPRPSQQDPRGFPIHTSLCSPTFCLFPSNYYSLPQSQAFKSNPQWFPPIYFPPPELQFLSPLCFFSDSFVPSFSPCVNMSVTQVHPGPPLPLPHMLPGLLNPHRPVIPKSVSQSWPLPWIPNSHPTFTRHLYLGVSQAPHTHDSHSARPCSSSYVPYFRKWHLPVSPRHSYHSWPPVTNFSRFFSWNNSSWIYLLFFRPMTIKLVGASNNPHLDYNNSSSMVSLVPALPQGKLSSYAIGLFANM